jgi:hypothetical protein
VRTVEHTSASFGYDGGMPCPRNSRVRFHAVLLALAALPAHAEREWHEVTTGKVRVVSAMNAAQTEKMAADVELYFEAAKRIIERPHIRPLVPLTLVALDRSLWLETADHTGKFGGFFLAHRGSADIVVDGSAWKYNSGVVFHELTHLVLNQNDPVRALPSWYHEGHADLLSTVEIENGLLKFGRHPPKRWATLQVLPWLPLEKVLTTRLADIHGREDMAVFYGQSWLIVHHAIFENPARNEQLHRYRQLLTAGVEAHAAFKSVFGAQANAYERELSLYGRRSKFKYVTLPIESLDVQKPQAHKLSETDGLNALGRLLLNSNRTDERDIEFLKGLAKAGAPDSVAVLQYANVLIRHGEVSTAKPLVEAGCVAPNAMRIAVLCGDAYWQQFSAKQDKPDAPPADLSLVERARKFYDVALQLEPDNLELLLSVADTFKALPGDSAAVRGSLESALRRDANNSWIAASLSDLYRPTDLIKARDYMERAVLTAPNEKWETFYAQGLNRIGSELAGQSQSVQP